MTDLGRREALLGGAFLALGAGCYLLQPKRAFARLSEGELDRAIPRRIGDYSVEATDGLILPPESEGSKKLYDKVLTRIYMAPDKLPIMALFAYGSTQNLTLQLHRPDKCYPMQGFEITPLATVPMELDGHEIPARLTTATRARENRIEQVLFWTRIGQAFPQDRWRDSWIVARANLHGYMPDGVLVRLSVLTDDRRAALAQMEDFAEMMVRLLPPLGRQILFGKA